MMKTIFFALAMAALGLASWSSNAAAARLEEVYNVKDAPISGKTTMANVAKAIKIAGADRHWVITEVSPGVLQGSISQGGGRFHLEAKIKINYDATKYSITYVDSEGFKYNDGMIHPHYNQWIKTLENEIQKELLRMG